MDAIFIFFGHPGSVHCLRRDLPALPANGTDPAASSHAPARVLCKAPQVLVAAASCARRHSRSRRLQPGPSAAGLTRPGVLSDRQAETSRPRPLSCVHSAQLLRGRDGHVLYVQTVTWKKMIYLRECHRFVVSTVSSL
jgi:hypothetical protein